MWVETSRENGTENGGTRCSRAPAQNVAFVIRERPSIFDYGRLHHVAATGLISSSFPCQAFLPLGTLPTAGHTHESRPIPCAPSPPGRGRVHASNVWLDRCSLIQYLPTVLKAPRTYINLSLPSCASFFRTLPPCDPRFSSSSAKDSTPETRSSKRATCIAHRGNGRHHFDGRSLTTVARHHGSSHFLPLAVDRRFSRRYVHVFASHHVPRVFVVAKPTRCHIRLGRWRQLPSREPARPSVAKLSRLDCLGIVIHRQAARPFLFFE